MTAETEPRVLIVDRNQTDVETARRALVAIGLAAEPVVAETLAEALQVAREAPRPALILVDCNLPDASDAAEPVRKLSAAAPNAFVIVSGNASEEVLAAARASHAAVIVKGPEMATPLREAIATVVEGERANNPTVVLLIERLRRAPRPALNATALRGVIQGEAEGKGER